MALRLSRLVVTMLGALLMALTIGSVAAQRLKPGDPYAVIRGTVFLDSGVPRPGVNVVLSLKSQPAKKLQEQISSPQGEFAFRVPPGPAEYVLTATLKGFETVKALIELDGQEQVNKTLLLVAASKK